MPRAVLPQQASAGPQASAGGASAGEPVVSDVGIRQFGYLTSMVVTITSMVVNLGLGLTLALR